MSKSANPGELRTPLTVVKLERGTDTEGFPEEKPVNVFGDGNCVYGKWVNAHGSDAFTAMQLQLREPATVTMRYSPLVTPECLMYRGKDPVPYEIISMDNVEERGVWLEIKVQRKVTAR